MDHYLIQTYQTHHEGFGSMMMDYAGLYATALATEHIPAICSVGRKIYHTEAFKEFNNNLLNTYTIPEAFPNFSNIFQNIDCDNIRFQKFILSDDEFLCSNHFSLEELKYYLKSSQHYNLYGRFLVLKHWYNSKYLSNILELYRFHDDIVNIAKALLPETKKKIVAVSLRYEYLINARSGSINPQIKLKSGYYYKAMSTFSAKDHIFLAFADYPEYHEPMITAGLKHHNLLSNIDIHYLPKLSSAVGMCLMSMCDHIICSNSTFSILAAALCQNPSKRVICPKYWMRPPNCMHSINCNYYPDSWLPLT